MEASATRTTHSCETCGGETQSVVLWGKTVHGRYCAGCAAAVIEADDERERRNVAAYLLQRAGETPRLKRFTWERASMATVGREWLESHRDGTATNLILSGAVGAGKTGLAWLIVRELCERRQDAMLVNLRNLLADMKHAMRTNTPSDIADRASRVSVLALDDLGAERPTAWALDELATIVDRRYERELPTIVTSNYDLDALARRLGGDELVLGQRIVSRLAEGARQVNFDAADRRIAA